MERKKIEMTLASETKAMFVEPVEAQADRKLFVHNLGEVIKQTRDGVASVELDDDDIVTITYKGGGTHRVSVKMDSYAAIIVDVGKNIT